MKSSETIAITESHKKVNKHPGSQYRYYFVLCNNPHQYLHEAAELPAPSCTTRSRSAGKV